MKEEGKRETWGKLGVNAGCAEQRKKKGREKESQDERRVEGREAERRRTDVRDKSPRAALGTKSDRRKGKKRKKTTKPCVSPLSLSHSN